MQILDGASASPATAKVILIRDNAGNNSSSIVKTNIASIDGTFIPQLQSPPAHFPVNASVNIRLNDGTPSTLVIRLQEVTNQSGWTIDQTGVNQAVSDLNAML